MKKKIIAIFAAVVVLAACAISAGIYYWSSSEPVSQQGLNSDPDAQSWSPSEALENDGQQGTRIPGYSTIVWPAGEKEVEITLYNPEENDCLFVYQLYLEGQEEEPLYTSGTIEPGKAVRSISLSRALQSGSYSLKLHIMPYDRETEAPLNDAVVTAALIVQ